MADTIPALHRAASVEWRVLTALLTLLTALLAWQNGLGRPDLTLYDAALNLSGRTPSNEIVIVAIDEASLAALGRWPWPRAVHATLLEKISAHRPTAVGLDLILAEPELAAGEAATSISGAPRSSADTVLARALRQAAPVVLPVLLEKPSNHGAMRTTMPLPVLAESAAALGHIHVEIDSDGIARSVFLREGPAETAQSAPDLARLWPHFALALKQAGTPNIVTVVTALPGERAPTAPRAGAWNRDNWLLIPFAGPPGAYARVSYIDVLLGRVPPGALSGKFVLIGATAAGLGDAYTTPVSGQSRAMPRVEINANLLDALLSERGIVRAPAWANAMLSAVIVIAVLIGLGWLTPRQSLMLVAAAIGGLLVCTWGALALAGIWFAPAACLAALLLAYPLWSWRRLEATLTYLGDEFSRLEAEPDILPRPQPRTVPAGGNMLEQRILALATATQRLRDTRRFTADTLGSLPDATLVADTAGKILLANRTAALHFGLASAAELRGRQAADLLSAVPGHTACGVLFSWDELRALTLRAEERRRSGALSHTAALEAKSSTAHGSDPGAARPAEPAAETTVETAAEPAVSEAIELTMLDGRRLLAHCARSVDAHNATLGWIVSLIDISALRAAEIKRDEVLAFLSHDMRAPQSSILVLLELHALDPARNSKEDVHARIENYARKTLDLSDQFLQLSHAETKEYEFAAVDLSGVAQEAIDEVWADSSAKNIEIGFQLNGEPAPVYADRAMLTRAAVNLLTNAIKYSAERTQITVAVTARDSQFVLEVADQGYGISADDQKHLFERYRRFSTPGVPKAMGAGLGMVFVKTVIEKHGGRVGVASAAGQGTTVTLSLPPFAG